MTIELTSLVAKFVLSHLPENINDDQLKRVLPSLDDEFIELATVVHIYMNKFAEKDEKILIHDVQALIKSGRLDDASIKLRAYVKKQITQ